MNQEKVKSHLHKIMHHTRKHTTKLEVFMSNIFAKAPHLPKELKDLLIVIIPWVAIVFGILGVVASLGGGTVSALLALPTAGLSLPFLVSFLFVFASSILSVASFSGLKAGLKSGWDKLFLSQILFILSSIILITFGGLTLGTVLGTLFAFYLMFEIRNHYK